MTLRRATILLVCLGTLTLMLAVLVITHFTIDSSFEELEREQAIRNMERAQNAIREELHKLDEVIVDWAVWDDAHLFMQGKAKDFVASNLNDRTLASLHLRAIVFLDRTGRTVWGTGFDHTHGVKTPLPEGLMARLEPASLLLQAKSSEERVKGLVLLPQGMLLLASCPISGSEGVGESSGTLVMLRPLGEQEAVAISERIRLPLRIERADSPLSADLVQFFQKDKRGINVGPLSEDYYTGLIEMPDIWGSPALRLVLRSPRDIMNRGDQALLSSHLWVAFGSAFFLAALLWFLERRVLRRLDSLKTQIEAIGVEASDAERREDAQVTLGRVEICGNDELSSLARRINGTLAELERSRRNLATQYFVTQEQESYLQQILDSIQAGVFLIDPKTHIIREANAFASLCAGRPREEIVGKLCHGVICPSKEGHCPITDQGLSGEQALRYILRPDGTRLPVLKTVSRIERSGTPFLLETFINVEDLQKAQEALKQSEETYRAVFMNTGTATILVEADTTIIRANQEFEKLSGFTRLEVEGQRKWTEFFSAADVEWMLQHHTKRRQSPELAPRNYESNFINRRGEIRPVLLTVGMIPATLVSVVSFEDIAERRETENQLRHQALHDTLTGLPNRLLLQDRLGRSVETARREGSEIAVLLMDLDRFKDVNDSLGHSAGDTLLRQVADRLSAAVRRSDTMARLGGDEFVLVVDGPAGRDAAAMIARHIIDCFAQPFEVADQSLHVRLSIGIALYPSDGATPELLLKNADLAMYLAKERGRNTFDFYTHKLNDQVVQRLAMESVLRHALSSGGVEVFYQPKVSQPGSRIIGAEALVRLRREDGALVSPADFIPVAEDTGLIIPLSEQVLRQAFQQAVLWRVGRHKDFVLAVNLSPRQFWQDDLLAGIRAIIQQTGIPPEALEFEITENLLMDSRLETLEALNSLRGMGAAVVLDDFGKEYSSLGYIKKLPIQAIKIDRSFIDGLPGDEDDATIVVSVLSMAKNLDLRVVAEGVETHAQLDFLVAQGCTEFQGYIFSRPLSQLDMTALLDQVTPFPEHA